MSFGVVGFLYFFAYLGGMESCCCDLQVDVNGEETFMVDKVVLCYLYLLISSAFSLCTFISNGFTFPSFLCLVAEKLL